MAAPKRERSEVAGLNVETEVSGTAFMQARLQFLGKRGSKTPSPRTRLDCQSTERASITVKRADCNSDQPTVRAYPQDQVRILRHIGTDLLERHVTIEAEAGFDEQLGGRRELVLREAPGTVSTLRRVRAALGCAQETR
jgi:hypothetical protein